jgi:hypothetical protein
VSASDLQERLGLSEEELLTILDADPLALIAGELDHRPELPILLALTEPYEPGLLQVWVRKGAIDLLMARDFAGFETALEQL